MASEVDEGFDKPAVFVTVYPSRTKLLTCGGATEEMTVTVEIQYISALETVEDCIDATNKIKQIFLYKSFDIQDRHITVDEMEFEIEKQFCMCILKYHSYRLLTIQRNMKKLKI